MCSVSLSWSIFFTGQDRDTKNKGKHKLEKGDPRRRDCQSDLSHDAGFASRRCRSHRRSLLSRREDVRAVAAPSLCSPLFPCLDAAAREGGGSGCVANEM